MILWNSSYIWCYLFLKILENEIWKFGPNLPLAAFGNERVNKIQSKVFLVTQSVESYWPEATGWWQREHNPVIVMTYITVYCCSASISVVVQFCHFSVKQARVIIRIRKFQWKSCFTSTHTCTSFKIISPSSGLAKKAFPTEMKCRKYPAKEKGSEEGSKTYWAILSFPHAWIWEAVMWYIIQNKQFK